MRIIKANTITKTIIKQHLTWENNFMHKVICSERIEKTPQRHKKVRCTIRRLEIHNQLVDQAINHWYRPTTHQRPIFTAARHFITTFLHFFNHSLANVVAWFVQMLYLLIHVGCAYNRQLSRRISALFTNQLGNLDSSHGSDIFIIDRN